LELSRARAHQRAGLDAATMAATLARATGAELELSDVDGHRAALELSDARATGQSWSCPTRAPPSALAVGAC
jgi:hypothetical protein